MYMPIVFIHRGNEAFVPYTLRQAEESNPHADIFFLGNEENEGAISGRVSFFRAADYGEGASDFAEVYQHLSTNSYVYNLFCFQRWFILRDFMRKNRIDRCCYLDTDVMLYTDINDPRFAKFSFEYAWTNPVDLPGLENFCSRTREYFRDPQLFQVVLEYTDKIGHVIHGQKLVSDMVLLALFFMQSPSRTYSRGLVDGSFFDGFITNYPLQVPPLFDDVEKLDGKKKVYLMNGRLFCYHLTAKSYIQANSLHFQGPPSKTHIPHFLLSDLQDKKGKHSFDYQTNQWVPHEE